MPLNKLTKARDQAGNLVPGEADIQDTTFLRDALSRFFCNTIEEALTASAEGFDATVIGAGMYGAYVAAKLFQFTKDRPGPQPRILVLQEGPFLIYEHFQNLPLGLGALYGVPLAPLLPPGQFRIINPDGTPESNRVSAGEFTPHHRCVGGKGLFWGGWTPSLTAADLAQWPAEVATYLESEDGYRFVSQEIGADYDTDRDGKEKDFIYGALYEFLLQRGRGVVPIDVPAENYKIDRVLQPPIAVKVDSEFSGLFSPDKYSSLPTLIDAIREDIDQAKGNDSARRLFLVPNVKVLQFTTAEGVVRGVRIAVRDPVGTGQVIWNDPFPVPERGLVILAGNTINSTRLARNSFPRPSQLTTERMGANLMVHVRGNYLWQVRRSVFEALDPTLRGKLLQQAALQVEATANNLGGKAGRFHFQFYAAPNGGGSAEAYLYQMMPDRDDLQARAKQLTDAAWITLGIRTCGEDFGDRDAPVAFGGSRSSKTSWMDTSSVVRDGEGMLEGFVQLVDTPEAKAIRQAQRAAAFRFIADLVGVPVADVGKQEKDVNLNDADVKLFLLNGQEDFNKSEDGLGTTYHECGPLWMGDDPETSVADVHGRLHHVANAYACDQSLFTTAGSANPVPTGLALARKVARDLSRRYVEEPPFADLDAGFSSLFDGSLTNWRAEGSTNFQVIQLPGVPPILEAGQAGVDSVLGLLVHTVKTFQNFVLRLEWKAFSIRANSGVFVRIADPAPSGLTTSFYDSCTEIQIDETAKNFDGTRNPQAIFGGFRERTGAIYQVAPATHATSKAIRPRFTADGPWNVFEITAKGPDITVALNSSIVSKAKISAPPRRLDGLIALQCHTDIVQFRKIRIKEIP